MSTHDSRRIRLVPSAPRTSTAARTAPSLRRMVEQDLAAHPGGLPWRTLWHDLAVREMAAGRPAPRRDDVVRVLGRLLVEGRADERNGRFIIRTQGSAGPLRLTA